MTRLDLDAIRYRSERYHSIARRLNDHGNLPELSGSATATAIGLAATVIATAEDVPDLLAEVERLRAERTTCIEALAVVQRAKRLLADHEAKGNKVFAGELRLLVLSDAGIWDGP